MKDQILRTLDPLIGEPLSGMFRFAGVQAFEFGVQRPARNRKGQEITHSDMGLHVACSRQVSGPEGFKLSSEDFDPDRGRRDEQAYPFYALLESDPPLVEAIDADENGALRLRLSRGFALEVNPDTISCEDELIEDEDGEQWRFLPKEEDKRHLVVTSRGIET
jgi:hypothetical protein